MAKRTQPVGNYSLIETGEDEWTVWDHEEAETLGTFDNYSDARDLQMEWAG
jgi:hypothetical protein